MDSLFSESDCDSFSESSEEMDFLFGGQALNLLSNLEESIGKIDDFLSYERRFLLGDIVCSVKDPSGQLGRVINCDMLVDLESIHGKVIKDVNSKKLIKIHSISVGDYVVYGHWLGRVDKVIDSITVLFDDGTKCDFTGVDLGKIVPTSPSALDDSQYPFYPGQRVRVQGPMASRSERWLCNSWKKVNQEQGTVCSIKAGFLYVDWLGSCLMEFDLLLQQPPNFQQAKNVTLLSCFSHANWQLGDWCMLQVTDHKNNPSRSERLDKCFHSWDVDLSSKEVFVIARTKTKVDVVWQDGSHSLAVDSQSLLPFNIVDSHEFWPEQFVLEKSGSDDSHAPISHKWGFVQGMDAKEKTVRVLWRSVCMGEGIEFGQEQVEETVSAYELIEHPDYSFCLGEVVFRLIQNESILQAAKDLLKDKAPGADEANFEHDKFERDHNDSLNGFYLSYIGSVVGFKDGMVEVKWANDLTTKVAPHEILRCDKHDDLSASPVPVNANVEQISQQIVHTPLSQKETDTPICWSDEEECIKNSQGDSCFSLPLNAMQFLTSIAVRLFGSFGSEPMLGSEHAPIPQDENGCPASHANAAEICNPGSETQSMVENDSKESELTSLRKETEGIQDKDLISKGSERFKQFDMVSDCSDHHFLDGAGKGLVSSSQVKRSWLKKVQQEWSILETNLPDSIYVRIYEERIDLLRAAIIGPPGTPYHDGLFFFDIFLPPEYPNEPPMVHYHSGGLRVNPNLYESGKVCLSLLNTWTGSGSEVWNPGNSTILQVLVSLQALVLNNKPYFNEAGYDKQIGKTEGERNSVSYNENAFLMTCKSMLYLLRKPPKHFEALVDEHFSNRCHGILLSCKEYMKGAPVGFAFGRGQMETENPKGSSTGFKIMLGKLFAKLVEALEDKGIDCRQLLSP